MTTSTDPLLESTAALAATYSRALGGGIGSEAVPSAGLDMQRMADADLLASLAATFEVVRLGQALLARGAGELNDRFEHDSGIAARTLGPTPVERHAQVDSRRFRSRQATTAHTAGASYPTTTE